LDVTGCLVPSDAGVTILARSNADLEPNNPGAPVFIAPPLGTAVTIGQGVTLHVTAGGQAPIQYQWRHEGVPIPGAIDSLYSIANVTLADAGFYDVVLTNALGSRVSEPFGLRPQIPLAELVTTAGDVVVPPQRPTLPGLQVESCLTPYVPTPNDPIKWVGINFIICQKADGSSNWEETEENVRSLQAIEPYLNDIYYSMWNCTPTDYCGGTIFDDTKIRFRLRNIHFIRDDVMWGTYDPGTLRARLAQIPPDALKQLNIFFTEGTYGASGIAEGPSTNLDVQSAITLLKSWSNRLNGNPPNMPMNSVGTIAHELGHSLDLLHTYKNPPPDCCPEPCTSSGECDFIRDLFCPERPCYHQSDFSCDPTSFLNTCDNNIMGGTSASCFFTEDQIGKMHRALSIKSVKRYLEPTGCAAPPNNLSMWLPLNETVGTTAINAAFGNAGTYSGGPVSDDEYVNRGRCLDGD